MYIVAIRVTNPLNGETRDIAFRLNPENFPLAAWGRAFAPVKALVDELVAAGVATEPSEL